MISLLTTQRNRNAKMRDAVEIIHRAVERIDHPLKFALLIADDSFFAIKRVIRKIFQERMSVINSCDSHIDLQFDVVRFGRR